ncbi:Uma2 family endonuclease [Opitutaceae bacterium TAV4]|nr:Uma2 family endonuclease [Opitutaceae bacterium TAV3]RRK01403.1 Uma2 family endonuclease [Opitutaceae bacterium TAV4]
MQLVTHRPLTVHDYRGLPDVGPQYQLVEGDLFMAPAPNRFHQTVAGEIYYALKLYLDKNPIGKAYIAPFDVFLTDLNVYQPDVCFFSQERYPFLTDEGASGPPDIVVEVLSPRTAHLDLGLKKEIYARTGVLEYWVVDPATHQVSVWHLAENSQTPAFTLPKNGTLTTSILPGFALRLERVFVE